MKQEDSGWTAVIIIGWILFIAFAIWLGGQPNTQDIAPRQCEQVGNC